MRPRLFSDDDAVGHDLDGVLELLLELDLLVAQVHHLAVDAHAREALAAQVVEELGVLALAPQHDWGEHVGATPLGMRQDLVGDLVGGLALDDAAALGAVRNTDSRVEQAQVVVDLGHGTHRGARVAARGLLVDGDRGRQAVDGVEVGLVHLPQEHAGVAGEALHVAPLALGVDGVKGEARLARAREARDDDELVARDGDVDVSEVVLSSAADDDGVGCHEACTPVVSPVVFGQSPSLDHASQNTCSKSQTTAAANHVRCLEGQLPLPGNYCRASLI